MQEKVGMDTKEVAMSIGSTETNGAETHRICITSDKQSLSEVIKTKDVFPLIAKVLFIQKVSFYKDKQLKIRQLSTF